MGEDRTPSGTRVQGPATVRHFVRELDTDMGIKPLIVFSRGEVIIPTHTIKEVRTVLRVAQLHGVEAKFGTVNGNGVYTDGDVSIVVTPEETDQKLY